MQEFDIWVFLWNMFSSASLTIAWVCESLSCFTHAFSFAQDSGEYPKSISVFTETLSGALFPLLTYFLCWLPTQTASGKAPARAVWVSSRWGKQDWSYLYAMYFTLSGSFQWFFFSNVVLHQDVIPDLLSADLSLVELVTQVSGYE